MKRAAAVLLLLAALIGAAIWGVLATAQPLPDGVPQALYDDSVAALRRQWDREPERVESLYHVADSAIQREDWEVAAAALAAIPRDHPELGRMALYHEAKVLLELDQARESEERFREFLRLEALDPRLPDQAWLDAAQRLRYLLEVQLRFEERHELIEEMLRRDRVGGFDVLAFSFPHLLRWNGPQAAARLERFWERDPQNPKLRIALGRYRAAQGKLDEAREILEAVCTERPDDFHAVAALIACLVEQQEWAAVEERLERLPAAAPSDPWLLLRMRGRIHNRRKEYESAAQCYRMVLAKEPADAESHLGLAAAYAGMGNPDKCEEALERGRVLARIQNRLGWVRSDATDVAPLVEIAELCRDIGLKRQAALMAQIALRTTPDREDVQQLARTLLDELQQDTGVP